MRCFYRSWAEVDLVAVCRNVSEIRTVIGSETGIISVVKADGYGHGLREIASTLMESQVDGFGVANLGEAQVIRGLDPEWPILMLGTCLGEELETVVEEGIMPTVSTLDEATAFSTMAGRMKRSVAVHVKVDTGMGRLGAVPDQAVDLIERVCRLPAVTLAGVCTHYAAAEDDPSFSRGQTEEFDKVIRAIRHRGIEPPMLHASNSAALLYERQQEYDTVRPGLLLYGVVPKGRRAAVRALSPRLKPALEWKCRVALVKSIPKGKPLSYGHTFYAPRPMRVATITVGYGDGYFRAASNRAEVLIRGKRCRILGLVTMDQAMVDVTHVAGAQAGDEVALLGCQGEERILAEELADWCGTIPWEILTNITQRVPRVYGKAEGATAGS